MSETQNNVSYHDFLQMDSCKLLLRIIDLKLHDFAICGPGAIPTSYGFMFFVEKMIPFINYTLGPKGIHLSKRHKIKLRIQFQEGSIYTNMPKSKKNYLTLSRPACVGCPGNSGSLDKKWHKTKCSQNSILVGINS